MGSTSAVSSRACAGSSTGKSTGKSSKDSFRAELDAASRQISRDLASLDSPTEKPAASHAAPDAPKPTTKNCEGKTGEGKTSEGKNTPEKRSAPASTSADHAYANASPRMADTCKRAESPQWQQPAGPSQPLQPGAKPGSGGDAGGGVHDKQGGDALPASPTGQTAVPAKPASPTPFDPNHDPLVDHAKAWKEGLFAARAVGRLPIEGIDGKGGMQAGGKVAPETLGKMTNATKIVGLGAFSIAANVQKYAEIKGYWTSGDPGDKWRALASTADFVNNARIGYTGFMPLMQKSAALTAFGQKYMGGAFGTKFGVGANAAAGAFKIGGAWQDFRTESKAATTGRDHDKALFKAEQATIGTLIDTGSDIYPYLSKSEPLAWVSWLGSKVADHAATKALEGSGYQPLSFGADHARNMMPVIAAFGLAPEIPRYDLKDAKSADERIVMRQSNTVDKIAGISVGVGDAAVTGVEVAGAAYLSRGKPGVIYATLHLDHMIRQGINVWSDYVNQRPVERANAVKAAGLDPAIDPRRVEFEQPDAFHRFATHIAYKFNSGRLEGKEVAGAATEHEKRYLAIVDRFEQTKISSATDGRASNALIFASEMQTMLINPALNRHVVDAAAEGMGNVVGWVSGGGIEKTAQAAADGIANGVDHIRNLFR